MRLLPFIATAMRSSLRRHLLAALAVLAWAPAFAQLAPAGQPQLDLPRTTLSIGMHRIDTQLATQPEQRQIGLMHRTAMPQHEGMLFVFEQPAVQCFWMRNTLIPLITTLGGSLPGLFSGALITETLFSIRGIGYASYHSMEQADIPFTMFYLAFISILALLGNLISDLLYAAADPRVRLS